MIIIFLGSVGGVGFLGIIFFLLFVLFGLIPMFVRESIDEIRGVFYYGKIRGTLILLIAAIIIALYWNISIIWGVVAVISLLGFFGLKAMFPYQGHRKLILGFIVLLLVYLFFLSWRT